MRLTEFYKQIDIIKDHVGQPYGHIAEQQAVIDALTILKSQIDEVHSIGQGELLKAIDSLEKRIVSLESIVKNLGHSANSVPSQIITKTGEVERKITERVDRLDKSILRMQEKFNQTVKDIVAEEVTKIFDEDAESDGGG